MRAHPLLVGVMIASATGLLTGSSAEEETKVPPTKPAGVQLPVEGDMPSLDGATLWLNSQQPLTAAGLRGKVVRRGKVVLVEFWTYTCINWLRQLPYVRAWAEKYKDSGLFVIGVHTPEFPFEKNVDNLRRAARDMRVDYPVEIDSDGAIWRSAAASVPWASTDAFTFG